MANDILVVYERIKNTLVSLGLEVEYVHVENGHIFYLRKRKYFFFTKRIRVCILVMYLEDIITCSVFYNLDKEIDLAVKNVLMTQGMRCKASTGRYSRIYNLL